jgi:hypothetical protein
MKVQFNFTTDSVANLIITAVETHCGWLENFNSKGLPRPDGVTWWEQLPKVLDTNDWFLSFEDIDGDKHVLNQEKVERGLRLLITEEPEHYSDWQSENEDAITADVFLQLCLLGEVVYG